MSDQNQDTFTLAGNTYQSRLLVGTGKYKDMEETGEAIDASGAEIVTVAVRRTNMGQNKDEPNILDVLPPDRYTILPNTAGCYDAKTAVRTCKLARELLDGHNAQLSFPERHDRFFSLVAGHAENSALFHQAPRLNHPNPVFDRVEVI